MAHHATSAQVRVLASPGMKEAILALIPAFENATGHKVLMTWSGTQNIKKQIAAGEVYDLVIVARPELDEFVSQGHIAPESRVDVMKSAVGAAVRAGTPKPEIGSGEELKKTLLAARSIGYSSGPSGAHMAELFQRLGIRQEIDAKLKQTPSGARVATMIASGEAEIGFQQVSELVGEPGIAYVGPLSVDVQKITVFGAGIHAKSREPQAARDLMKHLTSPVAASIIRKRGLDPA